MSVEELQKRYQTLSESTDLSNDSFSDMITALSILQEKMGVAGTSTKEALMTIQGSMNAAKAAWDNLVLEFGKPDADIGARVSDLMTALFGEIEEETGERVGGVVNNVMKELGVMAENIGTAIPQIIASAMEYLPQEAQDAVQAALDVFSHIGEKLGEVIDLDAISTAFDEIGSGISGFFESLSETVDFGYINVAIEELANIAGDAWSFVEENILPNLPELGELLGVVANFVLSLTTSVLGVVDALGPLLPLIVGAVTALKGLEIIGTIVGLIVPFVTGLFNVITMIQSFSGLIAVVGTLMSGLWIPMLVAAAGALVAFLLTNEDARAKIAEVWDAITQFVGDALSAIGDWIVTTVQQLGDGMSDMLTSVVDFTVGAIDAFAEWVAEGVSQFGEFVSTTASNIAEWASEVASNASDAMSEFLNSVTSIGQDIINWFVELPGRIVSALGDTTRTLAGAGSDIISGLWSGMQSAWESVKGWVSGLGSWIHGHKGPKQYDLALLVPNGQWIISGLDKGLRSSMPQIQRTLDDITDMMNVDASFDVSATGLGNKLQSASVAPHGSTVYNYYYVDAHAVTDERVASAVLTIVNQAETFREMGVTETGVANG